jgi:hypothetical protein
MRTMRASLALLAGAASTAYAFAPSSLGVSSLRPMPLSRSAHRSCRGPTCGRRSAAPLRMMVDPSSVRLRARAACGPACGWLTCRRFHRNTGARGNRAARPRAPRGHLSGNSH